MAAPVDQADITALKDALVNVLRLSNNQADILQEDGYDTIDCLIHWKFSDIRDWCELKTKLPATRGGVTYGDRKIKVLQALAWWATDRHLRGKPINLNELDRNQLEICIEEAQLEHDDSKKSHDTEKPSKFTHDTWTVWEESVYNYLHMLRNSRGVPLYYVIRKDQPDESLPLRDREIIYHAPLNGNMFIRDSKRVLSLLKELTAGTDAETWMRGARCGRDAMLSLQAHYDGESEGERRKQVARADLSKLFYRNESTFSFEKYVTKLKHIFNILERYKVPLYEEEKVKHLLDKINCPNAELKTEVSICRAQHATTFEDATTYLATVVSRIFPTGNPSSGRFRSRRSVNAIRGGRGGRGRGGRGRGRGRGRGGRGGRGHSPQSENGVDISDTTRWYSDDEWALLSQETQQRILNDPARAAAVEQRRKKRQRTNASVETSGDDPTLESNRQVAAIINGVMNASRQESQQPGQVRFPVNGSSRSVSGVQRSSQSTPTPGQQQGDDISVVTYDHHGNRV